MCYFLLSTNENLIVKKKNLLQRKITMLGSEIFQGKTFKEACVETESSPSVCPCKDLFLFLPNMLRK